MKSKCKIFVGLLSCLSILPATVSIASCAKKKAEPESTSFDINFELIGLENYKISNKKAYLNTEFNTTISYDESAYFLMSIDVYCSGAKLSDGVNMSIINYDNKVSIKIFDFSVISENILISLKFSPLKFIPSDYLDISGTTLKGLKDGVDLSSYNCLLVPANIITIGDKAFLNRFDNESTIKSIRFEKDSKLEFIESLAFSACNGLTSPLSLPEHMLGIGPKAFENCTNLSGLLIFPENITKIEDYAFHNCTSLVQIFLPECLETIGSFAFNDCTRLIGGIAFSDSVKNIGDSAFDGCVNLNGQLKFGTSCERIGNSAFRNCKNLTGSIFLPEALTFIGDYAFEGCENLTGNLSIPDGVWSIGNYAFANCKKLDGTLTFTSTSMLSSLKPGAFANTSFLGILDLSGCSKLAVIGQSAFKNCSYLRKLVFPDSLRRIDISAFENCKGLSGTIEFPQKIEDIEDFAFLNCEQITGFKNIENPDIGECAFYKCVHIKSIAFSDNNLFVGNMAFYGCKDLDYIDVSKAKFDKIPEDWSNYRVFEGISEKGKIVVDDKKHLQMWIDWFSASNIKFDADHWTIEPLPKI